MTKLSNTRGDLGVPDGTKDTPADRVYSIIQQVYDGELNPDEAFQTMLDILVETNLQLKSAGVVQTHTPTKQEDNGGSTT